MNYDYQNIEKKWQKYWEEHNTYFCDTHDFSKPKYYTLDMFPYPSGQGLHVGHPEGYTASDIVSRMKRMQGYNVLHPMGFDSFGLPAEQYAINTGNHPEGFTLENIETFKKQLKMLGFSFDWSKQISTCDPSYYKWTQWIFKQLLIDGYARLIDMPVNWCEELGTVLANDEVINGKSERGGFPVVRKNMKQWVLDIPKYAEALLEGLNHIDWPESTKEIQRNWIGKSEGAHVIFDVADTDEKFTVFTTRCDTLFGATYCVLAPEHYLVKKVASKEQYNAVLAYIEEARILSRRGDFNGAIKAYEKALEIDNRNVESTMELGSVYYQAGKLSKAEEKFRKAISMLEPCSDLTLTKFNLSTVLFDQNKISEAEKFAREAYQEKDYVKNDKTKANIIYNYALILDISKKVDEAIPFYMEVLKLNPNHTKTKINLGVMYMNLTPPDVDTAMALFLQVYNADKNNFEANNNLGNAYLLKEDYANAIVYYQNALKIDSKNLDAKSNLSRAYAKNGEYEKAKESYTELLRMNQKDWDAYIELAKVCIQLNQNNLAEGYLLTVKEKNPTFKAAEIDTLLESIK